MAEYLKGHRKHLIFLSVAVLVLLAGIGGVEFFSSKKIEKATLLAEDIVDVYGQWVNSADADKASVREELDGLMENAIQDYSGSYAEMRAYYTKGLLLAGEEKWSDSADSFLAVADKFTDSYLASAALFNAASLKDQAGDVDAAMALFQRILDEFADVSSDIPEVLFNMGRLYEEKGNGAGAVESYEKIVSDYSSSSWTNIAKSRIIAINTSN